MVSTIGPVKKDLLLTAVEKQNIVDLVRMDWKDKGDYLSAEVHRMERASNAPGSIERYDDFLMRLEEVVPSEGGFNANRQTLEEERPGRERFEIQISHQQYDLLRDKLQDKVKGYANITLPDRTTRAVPETQRTQKELAQMNWKNRSGYLAASIYEVKDEGSSNVQRYVRYTDEVRKTDPHGFKAGVFPVKSDSHTPHFEVRMSKEQVEQLRAELKATVETSYRR